MNAAIITARGGSKSIKNKNVFLVDGKPMVHYPIQAAIDAQKIDKIFISTDDAAIAKAAEELGAIVIPRPVELGGDSVNHGDVIKHATLWVNDRYPELANVVLLLGNTVFVDGDIIDRCLQKLDDDRTLDSCMTVWEAQDDHPNRAMEINEDGMLEAFGDKNRKVSTERQSYKTAYYYDQGVWAYRKYTVNSEDGVNPWWWMGKRSAPIVRIWVTGRDVHTMFDIGVAEWWLQNQEHARNLLKQSSESGL